MDSNMGTSCSYLPLSAGSRSIRIFASEVYVMRQNHLFIASYIGLASHLAVAGCLLALAGDAFAIPAFARKYGTSCLTCHTVYPKLTPFGEAFRRNGYRFPGVDSDYVKQETVALGQEANKKTFPKTVWPDALPISVPIAIGANGQAFAYPARPRAPPVAG